MSKDKSKILKEKIILAQEKLDQIISPNNILTSHSLSLSRKLDKLILEYYRIQQTLS